MEQGGGAPAPKAEQSARTGYGINPLDRQSGRRDDVVHVDAHWGAATTRCLVLAGEEVAIRGGAAAPDPLFRTAEALGFGRHEERAFLGVGASGALFALRIEDEPTLPAGVSLLGLRAAATGDAVAPALLGALGQAKSLLGWHARHRFCPACGAPSRVASAGWRRVCDACGTQHFPRVDPVVIMLVARGDTCLLGRQTRFPPNMYSCLAGFIEPGETAEDAVRREVMEEAGIGVEAITYLATQPWPFPGSLMLGFLAQATSDALTIDETELEDARWVSRADVRLMLARRHPGGLTCPLPVAVAHTLLTHWAAIP